MHYSRSKITIWFVSVGIIVISIVVGIVFVTRPQNGKEKVNGDELYQSGSESESFVAMDDEETPLMIQSIYSGYCLEIDATNGVDIILSKCNGNNFQLWTVNADGRIRSYLDNRKCLDVRGSYFYDDVPIELQDCERSIESQLWNFAASGEIRSPGTSNYCIDENGLSNIVTIWFCSGADYQFWRLVPLTPVPSMIPTNPPNSESLDSRPRRVIIKSVRRDKYCLSPPVLETSSTIIVDRCDVDEAKISWLINEKEGLIRLHSDQRKCIEITGPSFQTGSVELRDCNLNKTGQKWDIYVDGTIRPLSNADFCLDENGLRNEVYLLSCDFSLDQKWNMYGPETSEPSAAPSGSTKPSRSVMPSISPSISPDQVLILSSLGEYCMDVPKSDALDGTKIILSECRGDPNQLWIIDSKGFIRSALDRSKCIQLEDPSDVELSEAIEIYDGRSIETHDCEVGKDSQIWDFLPSGTIKSRVGFLDYCLDGNGIGNVVFVWLCDEKDDQLWTTNVFTLAPTLSSIPTSIPSEFSSKYPSESPTEYPSKSPTSKPTSKPSQSTDAPSMAISNNPTENLIPISIQFNRNNHCIKNPDRDSIYGGNTLRLSECNSTADEKWYVDQNGYIHSYSDNSKCIGIRGIFLLGEIIEIQDCADKASQQWKFLVNGEIQSMGITFLRGCLDGYTSSIIKVLECNGSVEQSWSTFIPITEPKTSQPTLSPSIAPTSYPTKTRSRESSREVEIRFNLSGHCMNLRNSETTNNNLIILSQCEVKKSQRWIIDKNGLIRSSLDSNKCIQVGNQGIYPGLSIKINDCENTKLNQQWHFPPNGEIISKGSQIAYCLDGNGSNGAIVLWACAPEADQLWTIAIPEATISLQG